MANFQNSFRYQEHHKVKLSYLTAYTTRLVISVVCRGSIPARGDIAIRQLAPESLFPGAVADLLRFRARRPIRIQLQRAGQHRRVPWVNNPTLTEFCFGMIGRADIEGSKSNVAMNAWLPQASYPCGNFSGTSSLKFRGTKGSIGHTFMMCRPSQTPHLTIVFNPDQPAKGLNARSWAEKPRFRFLA
ncbi:senescence-associated protein [Coccidioides immitis H538.4]|uniref:Senescence-associated protein n=1 Tax=Coccidioides immitis H538.4 TaxID=396776 RepID=A0A0N8FLL6_COCIT|nr:senescence-associated protein [Coccidioides immitis H538.4]